MRDQLSRERRDLPWELIEKQIHLRGRARDADTQRPLRGTRAAGQLSRDVQPRHRGGPYALDAGRALLRLLVLDGQLQRRHRPSEPPRHHDGLPISDGLAERRTTIALAPGAVKLRSRTCPARGGHRSWGLQYGPLPCGSARRSMYLPPDTYSQTSRQPDEAGDE